jgi:hypothetical protein
MSGIILGLREYIFLSLKELPLIAMVAPIFLGISEGNINLLMFGLGNAILAPTAAGLTGWLLRWPLNWLNPSGSVWKMPASDVSPLLSETPMPSRPLELVPVVPTYWMTITVFFFTYLLFNGASLYNEEPVEGADAERVNNRKSQALMAMILISVLGLVIIGAKISLQDGGENVLGILIAVLIGTLTSYGWFSFLKRCDIGRLEDVFGIQARILPESALSDAPVVCV